MPSQTTRLQFRLIRAIPTPTTIEAVRLTRWVAPKMPFPTSRRPSHWTSDLLAPTIPADWLGIVLAIEMRRLQTLPRQLRWSQTTLCTVTTAGSATAIVGISQRRLRITQRPSKLTHPMLQRIPTEGTLGASWANLSALCRTTPRRLSSTRTMSKPTIIGDIASPRAANTMRPLPITRLSFESTQRIATRSTTAAFHTTRKDCLKKPFATLPACLSWTIPMPMPTSTADPLTTPSGHMTRQLLTTPRRWNWTAKSLHPRPSKALLFPSTLHLDQSPSLHP